ncbi:unnamed protein product [Musa textilis]
MLKRLCFNPSTNNTSSIKKLDLLLMVPLLMILPLLSPKVTYSSSWLVSLENCNGSPVMCLEHPLSRYHLLLLACVDECVYKKRWFLGTHLNLGALKIDLLILSFCIKLIMVPFGTHINLCGLTFSNGHL